MKIADAPRLPKLPFILSDVALLAFGWFIAARHPNPLSPLPLIEITGCVVAGMVVLMIPYLVNYGRDQEDAATSLRDELSEQFKRLIAASEHLQHATVQLKSIEEASAKNVEAAERLPYRMQEKIAEFNLQLAEAGNKEKAMIAQELAQLRAGESELLSKVSDQIAQALTGWAKIEADARQQFADTAARERDLFEQQLAKVRATENEQIAAVDSEVTKALAGWVKIELDARRQLSAVNELQEKLAGMLATVDTRIGSLEATVDVAVKAAERFQTASPGPAVVPPASPAPGADTPIADQPEPAARAGEPPPAIAGAIPASEAPSTEPSDDRASPEPVPPDPESGALDAPLPAMISESIGATESVSVPAESPSPSDPISAVPETIAPPALPEPDAAQILSATTTEETGAPPASSSVGMSSVDVGDISKYDISPPEPVVATDAGVETAATEPLPAMPAPALDTAASSRLSASEPPPDVPAVEPLPEPTPDSPAMVQPDAPEPSASTPEVAAPPAPPRPRKPRAPRKPKPEGSAPAEAATETVSSPAPGSESPMVRPPPAELISEPVSDEPPAPENFSQLPPEENKPAANPAADGRTRLTVISYIGIGNKLHLRGDGPGLSWTKGVPLQFVSIGRWRWETDAASAPVVCRIYKNDKLEAPIGPLTLAPGTEQEISATF